MNYSLQQLQSEITKTFTEIDVITLPEVDSTNRYLKDYSRISMNSALCFASSQTKGYGQQTREWVTDDSSLTFSLLLDFNVSVDNLDGLAQLVVLNLIESLSDFSTLPFKVKWPNDLYIEGLKAGGILVECVSYHHNVCRLVIGIGLNNGINSSVVDVHTGQHNRIASINLNRADTIPFLKNIIHRLLHLSNIFHRGMFSNYLVNYALVDYFAKEQPVNVYDNGFKKVGVYKGLGHNGELLVEVNGHCLNFRSGSVSIRPTN